jgi:hypothetical protein
MKRVQVTNKSNTLHQKNNKKGRKTMMIAAEAVVSVI